MRDLLISGLSQNAYPTVTPDADTGRSVVVTAANTVLTGSIDATASTAVVGVGTLFNTELVVGDYILVTGETRRVTVITDDLNLTVDTAFTDLANDTTPEVVKGKGIDVPAGSVFAKFTGDTDFYVTFDGTAVAVPADLTSSVSTVSVLNPDVKHIRNVSLIRIDASVLSHVSVEFFK